MRAPTRQPRTRSAVARVRPSLFVAHLSHEMRTPLNAIIGLAEALGESVYGPLNPKQAKSVATIRQSGQHLLALVNDLLDLSRLQSGGMRFELGVVPVRRLLDESVAVIAEAARQRRQTVELEVGPHVGTVPGDGRRLKQAVLNLLSNATKFAGLEGHIRVVARPGRARELVISIWDSGPGISAADVRRLFKPFATLDRPLTRANQGAGLGLALSKKLVEHHGGSLRIGGGAPEGTTFTLRLPGHDSASAG